MIRFGYEIPGHNSVIIGDIYSQGQLFYQGRPQGPHFNGANDAELREKAKAAKARILAELGKVEAARVYPQDAWELRIWD